MIRFFAAFCVTSFLFATWFTPCVAEETNDYIHYQLGVKYKNDNKFDQAIDEFRKLLTAYPDNYNTYMQLADIRHSQNQPRLVVYNLKKALVYNPGWTKAQKMLAEAYEQDKQYQNAIIEYQHYQQICDPSELDSVQIKINKLVKRVKGEPEPVEPLVTDSAKAVSVVPAPIPAAKKTDVDTRKIVPPVKQPTHVSIPEKKVEAAPSPTAESWFQQAVALYDAGKMTEALPLLKKAVALQKDYAAAFYYAGLIRYKLGQSDLAKVNFTKSFAYPDGESMAHYYLGKILGTEKNYKEAVSHLTEYVATAGASDLKKEAIALLEHYKSLIGDRTPLPSAAFATGDTLASRSLRSQFVSVAPETSISSIEMRIDSLLMLSLADTLTDAGQAMLAGLRCFKSGAIEDATREFKKVMAAYPAKAVAAQCLYDIGVCYMKLQLFTNAENQFDQVIARFPSHALASSSLFFKAYSYFERGDMNHAEKMFREFIQKYRSHPWIAKAYEKLGDMYVALHQLPKAIESYSQAAALYADGTDKLYALFKLGSEYTEAGNAARARETFVKIVDFGEKNHVVTRVPDAYFRIADADYQAKNFKTALDMYQKVTRKYPTYQETPWGLFQVGNIYKNIRDYQKAIDTFKYLAKTYPDDYWARQAKWKMEDAVWENEYRNVLN
jgi:tetratricopeptide (TPR) repeat protein